MKTAYMYILKCADGSYYTGSTVDLERRLWQHQNGEGANYTKKHLPVELVYYEEYNEDFNYIFENQLELFGRDDVFLKWKRLKETDNESLNRYKTLDGQTLDKIKEINEDTLFYHVNISAKTCITRIANIMNKLYIDENDVKIKLKN